ncbi:hypothetical protein PROFUN_13175 [Planoprotostelium fungivorum]|uniref:Uncharacterized protein n=1 Tax=Planoprotostelium fungivorum TaxID=1890364 RepID=A0A2P6N552_9EUKA|nr:hypothetical protein PROFUN_13175 [Planoprotostelium fungivorum]
MPKPLLTIRDLIEEHKTRTSHIEKRIFFYKKFEQLLYASSLFRPDGDVMVFGIRIPNGSRTQVVLPQSVDDIPNTPCEIYRFSDLCPRKPKVF